MNPYLPPHVRSLFPGALDKVYFNIAETTLIPQPTANAARAYLDGALSGTGDKDAPGIRGTIQGKAGGAHWSGSR